MHFLHSQNLLKYFVNNGSKVYGTFLDAIIRVVLSQHPLRFLNR